MRVGVGVRLTGMAKVTIEVSEELAALILAAEAKLEEQAKAAKEFAALDIDGTQAAIREAANSVGKDMQRRWLQSLDTEEATVVIDGKRCAKVGRYETTFRTLEGPVKITRSLYRERGVRNGRTMDVVSARVGAVADGWLPEAAKAMAFLHQQAPSREAEALAKQLHRLPYSRSSFERLGHAVGTLHSVVRDTVEDALMLKLKVPRKAMVVSISLDRVALPMEEPLPRPVGRPKKGAAKRPVARVFRMAYCATITLHELGGEALFTIRYGRMPKADVHALCDSLAADVKLLLKKCPRLAVTVLTDGAPEMSQLLDGVINETTLGKPVHKTLDFWHLTEKLGRAAVVMRGEAKASALIESWKLSLLNTSDAWQRILRQLRASGLEHVRVADARPVHDAITYLENHAERLDYAEARRQGLPIGSGHVEATCKSLVGLRMKRPGARWKEDTGQHVLDLRALALSNRWNHALTLTLEPLRRPVSLAA